MLTHFFDFDKRKTGLTATGPAIRANLGVTPSPCLISCQRHLTAATKTGLGEPRIGRGYGEPRPIREHTQRRSAHFWVLL